MDEFFAPPKSLSEPMNVPTKTLMGPGPSNMPKRVQDALNNPILGHLHPECLKVLLTTLAYNHKPKRKSAYFD